MHDWSGRLPLAIWGLVGVAVLYVFLGANRHQASRPRRTARSPWYATMPLFFMQARTMLGDAVTMAALAMAFCGLAGAMLDGGASDADDDSEGWLVRFAWLGVGLLGLVCGYLSRGMILGVAVPSLSVGLTWVVLRLSGGASEGSKYGEAHQIAGALALVVGLASLAVGVLALVRVSPDTPLRRLIGFAVLKKTPVEATFDLTIRQLGHALFPWSAFLPFAVGRLFRAPVEASPASRDREVGVRVALLVGAGVALVAYGFVGPYAGALPFAAPALLAGIAAVAIADLERGAAPSRGLAIGVLVLGFVLYRDMVLTPEKALSVFSVEKATFPKSFEEPAEKAMKRALLLFAASLVALTWFAKPRRSRARRLALDAWVKLSASRPRSPKSLEEIAAASGTVTSSSRRSSSRRR